jgi:nucleotide-binding universal stress UspA family protein
MTLQGPILVPLDGSELAERAVPVAAELARRAGVELRLLHVYDPMAAEPIYVKGLPVIDDRLRSLGREHEQAYLDRAPQRLAPGARVSVALLDGPVATAIVGYADRSGAALIVITSHARGGFERAWLGSVTDEMVRISHVPLLVVRPEPGQVTGPFRRILVPLDGSATAESILEHAVRLARLEPEAELVLLEIVQPMAPEVLVLGAPFTASLPREHLASRPEAESARAYLDGVVRRLEASGMRVRARVEIGAIVAPAILEIAHQEQADVVALATHGRSGFARLRLGSVADKLVRGSHTPILLFKPPLPPAPGLSDGSSSGERVREN